MTKWMLAVLSLVALTFALGGTETGSAAAAPPAPAATEPAPPEFGGCRWYCNSRSFTTRAACQAACSFACEQIC